MVDRPGAANGHGGPATARMGRHPSRPRAGRGAMTVITFFVVSGYVFVGFLGRRIRPKVLFRVKSVVLLTTISVPITLGYDLWTAFGEWYFLTRPFGVTLA